MIPIRQLFLSHMAQTSESPLMLEIAQAKGMYLYGPEGKKYMDLISGISVSNLGHNNEDVVKAVKIQVEKYMHLMVYGEYIQTPQVAFAKLLTDHLPSNLQSVYFVNSGSEATEGALKLAKKYTGRSEIVYFKNSYHGSTHGALSVMGNDYYKRGYGPLLPGTQQLEYNRIDQLQMISEKMACVILEPIQAESGVTVPANEYMKLLRNRCDEMGALLILDEVQTGFGRTGSLFAFDQLNIVPDILLLAKSLGGGMPLGAFISSSKIMASLKTNPALGHITTFGGHPVSCAAGLASLNVLLASNVIDKVKLKEVLFRKLLVHPSIKKVRSKGLLISVEFENFETNKKIIDDCIANGVIVDWFLFAENCLRIAPPLIISEKEIETACQIIVNSIEKHAG